MFVEQRVGSDLPAAAKSRRQELLASDASRAARKPAGTGMGFGRSATFKLAALLDLSQTQNIQRSSIAPAKSSSPVSGVTTLQLSRKILPSRRIQQ
jgi:hypothetical protein